MTNPRTTHILARLETGFRTEAAHRDELEQDLNLVLRRARKFGAEQGDAWNASWQQQWDGAEATLRRIMGLVNEMDGSIASGDPDRLQAALETWATIQTEEARWVEAVGVMRAQVMGLKAEARTEGNILARTLETHGETTRAWAQALRIKLELRKQHSKEEVEQLVQEILAQLPDRTRTAGLSAELYEQEYTKATAELEKEHHKYLGFMDTVKALLLWVESPEERTRKNLTDGLEKA